MLKTTLKIFLSLWILYHLVGILIMPSPQSILVKNWAWIFRPYLNALTINTTWNLFSPDPGTATFLKINVISDKEESGVRSFTWPRNADRSEPDSRHRRELYFVRYTIMNDMMIYKFLFPWLCRNNPDAQEIRLEVYTTIHPSLEQASTNRNLNIDEMKSLRLLRELNQSCHLQEGESL